MSLHRLVALQRFNPAARRLSSKATWPLKTHPVRWQTSNVTPPTGVRWGRLLGYGLTTAGLTLGATLVYANYDPIFKNKVNVYVPGFASLADSAADRWVDLVDYVNPKRSPSVGLKGEKEKVKVGPIFEPVKPKSKPVKREEIQKEGMEGTSSAKTPEVTKIPDVGVEKSTEESSVQGKISSSGAPIPEKSEEPSEATKIAQESQAVTVTSEKHPTLTEIVATEDQTVEKAPPEVKEESGATEQKTEEEFTVLEDEKPSPSSSVENAVASVKEETARAAKEIMSEQLREHQEAQTADEHFSWLKDSSQVDAKLQETFELFESLSSKVLEAQKSLKEAIQSHHQRLAQATKSSPEENHVDFTAENIASAEEVVQSAEKDLKSAMMEHGEATDSLYSLLERATSLGLRSKVEQIEGKLAEFASELLAGATAIAEVESRSKVLEDYQQEVQKNKEQLQRELGTALPEADSQQEALVLLLQKRVDLLKRKLEKAEKDFREKLTEALEKQQQSLEQLGEEKLKLKLQKQEQEHRRELQLRTDEVASYYDGELREQLRMQTETHTHHLSEALQTQADQLSSKWAGELELKLMEQEAFYQKEMAKALARLRGIEHMVDTVAHAGEITRRQQSLRAACDTLNNALQQANANPDPTERYRFSSEVAAVHEAAENDHFILNMLDSIPRDALSGGGIQSEASLKERFRKVKRVCERVALVPETGGGLGTYALSFIQSVLTFSAWGSGDVDVGVDPREMDTFKLLHQAEVLLNRGELEEAVRYVNQLRGEPRRVAHDWLRDARLYLETRQAVLLISEYLAVTSISLVR